MDKGAGKPDPDSLAEVKALWPEVTAKVARLPYLRNSPPVPKWMQPVTLLSRGPPFSKVDFLEGTPEHSW
jgi:hypothetical protein